jgi:hypothetical protein
VAEDKPFLWYFGGGSEPEGYHGGYLTREEAISEGRSEYGLEVFSIVEAQKGYFHMIDADQLLEQLFERWGDDDFGAEDMPELHGSLDEQKAATDELNALLSGWFEKHRKIMPTPWAFAETRNEETFNLDVEEA